MTYIMLPGEDVRLPTLTELQELYPEQYPRDVGGPDRATLDALEFDGCPLTPYLL